MIRTLLVDDENLIRQTLKLYLESERGIEIIGTADNGAEAIALVEQLEPDVVLLDIEMPTMNGIAVTKLLKEKFPKIEVVILSSHDESEYLNQALAAGAKGYLLKNTTPQELSRSIEFVDRGYLQLAPGLVQKLSLAENPNLSPSGIDLSKSPIITQQESSPVAQHSASLCRTHYDFQAIPSEDTELATVEPEDFLPAVSNWTSRGAIALLGIFGATLLLSNMLEYQTTVKSSVKIRPTGELRVVQASAGGKVTSIEVEANQAVDRGDALAVIDSSMLQTKRDRIEQEIAQFAGQLAQTKAQIANIEREIVAATAESKSNERMELELADASLELATEELDRFAKLRDTGAVSELQITQKRAALREAIAKQNKARATANAYQQEQAHTSSLNRERQTSIEKQIGLAKQLASAKAERRQIDREIEQTTIRASASGIINELNLRNVEQVVDSKEVIATIVPFDAQHVAIANVAPQDVGGIEVAQRAQIKVSACPYPDYGVLAGSVRTISADAVASEEATESNDSYQIEI